MAEFLTRDQFIWPKTFIANFYDIFLVVMVANSMLGNRLKTLLKYIAHFAIACCIYTFVIRNKIFIDIVAYIYIMIVLFRIIFARDWYDTINVFTLSFATILFIWLVLKLFTTNFILNTDPFYREIVLRSITFVFTFLYCATCPIENIFFKIRSYTLSYKLVTQNLMMIIFSVVILIRLGIQLSFIVLITIILVFTITNIYSYSRFKLSYQQQLIEINNKSSEIFDGLVVRLRNNLHEEKNRIQAISMLPNLYDNYDELKKAIQEYTVKSKDNKAISRYLNISRKFVAALIIAKVMEAETLGIQFQTDIKDYAMKAGIDDYRLSEIFGTLIDNAFDAVSGLKEEKTVKLKVYSQFGSLVIETLNPCREIGDLEMKRFFQKGYSTKASDGEQHGIGLYNLHQIVNEFDGTAIAYGKRLDSGRMMIIFKITI